MCLLAGRARHHQHVPSPIKLGPHTSVLCPCSGHQRPSSSPESCLGLGFPHEQLSYPAPGWGCAPWAHWLPPSRGLPLFPLFVLPFCLEGALGLAAVQVARLDTPPGPLPGRRPSPGPACPVLGVTVHTAVQILYPGLQHPQWLPNPLTADFPPILDSLLAGPVQPAEWCSRRQDLREQTESTHLQLGSWARLSEGRMSMSWFQTEPERAWGEGKLEPRPASVAFGPGHGGRDRGRLSGAPKETEVGRNRHFYPSKGAARGGTAPRLGLHAWPFLAARSPDSQTRRPLKALLGRWGAGRHFSVVPNGMSQEVLRTHLN